MLTPTNLRHKNVNQSDALRPTKIVRLVYFDEAGTSSLKDEPMTVVAAVIVNGDNQWSEVEERLKNIVDSLVPERDRANFEFHAKELFSSGTITHDWGKRLRWEVFTEFLKTFQSIEIPIVWAGADRARTMQSYAGTAVSDMGDNNLPHALAFAFCQVQVELWFRTYAPDEKGICIADPVDRKGKDMNEMLEEIQRQLRVAGVALVGQENFKLNHIIDAVSFVDSHKSIGVQLSDACNFLIKRHEAAKTDSEPFYKMIEPWIQNFRRVVFS